MKLTYSMVAPEKPTTQTTDSILTAEEVAKELRISKSQVQKLLRGEVEGVKPLCHIAIGRRRVVPRSVFERWKQESISGMIAGQSEKNTVDASKGVVDA
jgi:transcriptional regulator with XRE-family HTH domain